MKLSDGTVARLLRREPEVFAGRFEVLGEAGAGGMGAVYRAVDGETGELVALKVLRADIATGGLERFQREASILERLEHPAIVRYVAHGTNAEGEPWLAMEWLDGVTLSDRLRQPAPLSLGEALSIALRIATALETAHAHGVVHRDLKPGNIVLAGGRAADAKVIDFGIARTFAGGEERDLTRTGQIVGTPGYMAPEQLRGTREIDGRADLFALGCVLYRMVGGQPAFGGDDVLSVIAKIAMDTPVDLRTLRPAIPASLDALVSRLMEKQPRDRPADASSVAGELRLLADDVRARGVDITLTPSTLETDPTLDDGRARTEAPTPTWGASWL